MFVRNHDARHAWSWLLHTLTAGWHLWNRSQRCCLKPKAASDRAPTLQENGRDCGLLAEHNVCRDNTAEYRLEAASTCQIAAGYISPRQPEETEYSNRIALQYLNCKSVFGLSSRHQLGFHTCIDGSDPAVSRTDREKVS